MSLRERLEEILPPLLPLRAQDAIKGTELIARVRAVLGEDYSDRSLRSQFSLIALEPDSCLARVSNGQGYYLRSNKAPASLQDMFGQNADTDTESATPRRKALALAVRLYDTAGLGVFVYPADEDSWEHPDLVAVQWPAGHCNARGAYMFDNEGTPTPHPSYRAVCVAAPETDNDCREAFFRTLSCGLWAQESELLLLCPAADVPEELRQLSLRFGVGIRTLETDAEILDTLPRANIIFRAEAAEARRMLSMLPQSTVAHPRTQAAPLPAPQESPDIAVVIGWANSCIARGCIEPYEQRVAVN